MVKGNIEAFLSDLVALKEKMDRNDSSLTPEVRKSGLKKQLFEYRRKEEQIQEDIEREMEDFFSLLHIKKASIEALAGMGEYVRREISRLETLLKADNEQ